MMNRIDPALVPVKELSDHTKMPGIGIGTFGSDKYSAGEIAQAVYGAVKGGYRLIDCASVYENEKEIGGAIQKLLKDGIVKRDELYITSKVWNDKHREVAASCRKSREDLALDFIDLFFVHWPFPNYHAPGCDGDSRNPDSRPFSLGEFMDTWHQCEQLVEQGLVRHIGMSNMTITKLEQILPLCKIQPAAIEMELHPAFQQPQLYQYVTDKGIVPIGYCPIGSPSRPLRDKMPGDIVDTELKAITSAAVNHGVHPAMICLKWAVQHGHVPIPFSVKEDQYLNNLRCVTQDPLTQEEMAAIAQEDKNCRLVKGQVFLWEGAKGWEELWDE